MRGDDEVERVSSARSPQRTAGSRLDFGQALAAAGVAAWRWEIGDGSISWSPGAAEILGIPDLVLKSPELLTRGLEPEDLALISAAVERAGRSDAPLEARIPHRLGPRVTWYDVAGQVLFDGADRPVGATGTAIEVTDRHLATEAVVAALGEAEAALDQLGALVFRWDPNTGLLSIRRQPEGLTLTPEAPADASVATLLDRMDENDSSRFRDALAMSWYDGRPFMLELTMRGDDEVPRRILLRARRAETDDQSDLVGVILE